MKTILSISLLLASLTAAAQPVDHFDEPSARWHVAHTYAAATAEFPSFDATTTDVWGFSGDTLIYGQTWLKMYSSPDSNFVDDLEFKGYIRQEQDVVLYRDSDLQPDTLYDFTLEPGALVEYEGGAFGSFTLELLEVDFVEIDGEQLKRFIFSTEPATLESVFFDVWIEGIGSIHRPLQTVNPAINTSSPPDSTRVTCTSATGDFTWQNPHYENCMTNIVLSSDEKVFEGITAFPNPFLNSFRVVNDRTEVLTLNVYSGQGQAVKKLQCPPGEMQVDLSAFADGLYYLVLSDEKDAMTLKMMKTR
ncbi:MAG: T9SS type A sorting domain-containing protein [Flavobacteriales bacterium]|nr:T9SS type A sorting domain-containing protein [Flavobacteriales bacterium]